MPTAKAVEIRVLDDVQSELAVERPRASAGDAASFEAMKQRYIDDAMLSVPGAAVADGPSIAKTAMARVSELSEELRKDQSAVKKLLEKASATGDQETLMRAVLALRDFETRVQLVAKTASKATDGFKQLYTMQ